MRKNVTAREDLKHDLALARRRSLRKRLACERLLTQTVHRESPVMAFSDVFLTLAVIFMAMVVLVPLIRKPMPRGAPADGGH